MLGMWRNWYTYYISVCYHGYMKRGPVPKSLIATNWSPIFAYAMGLFVADGSMSKDGRHMSFVSKDKVQVETFKRCLGVKTKTSRKYSGAGEMAYHTQFGGVIFYNFLLSIGLCPAKSKTIAAIGVPNQYFIDFLRGYFDGDGSSYSYYDPIYPRSFRFIVSFTSGSINYLTWLQGKIFGIIGIRGYITTNKNHPYPQLKFGKRESCIFAQSIYYKNDLPYLKRKYLKIKRSLRIIKQGRSGEIGRRAAFRAQ